MKRLIIVYICMIGVFLLETLLFMLFYHNIYGAYGTSDWLDVLGHSLPHDLTLAGYVVALPLVLWIVQLWVPGKWYRTFCVWYLTIMSLPLFLLWLIDLVLFGYWSFRLDATPLIYLTESPAETLSQGSFVQYALPILLLAALVWMVNKGLRKLFAKPNQNHSHLWREAAERKPKPLKTRVWQTVGGLLMAGFCFLAIRGGVSESTMNIGRAYYSTEMMLNQAAVNPAFSFFYSVTRKKDYGKMYRFMSAEECAEAMSELEMATPSDSTTVLLDDNRPNVLLIILEGFTGKALTSLYPDEADPRVMPRLAELYQEGVGFTRFYANSWRTDRGIASILAAYPAQPKTSIAKEQDKCNNLQYITRRMSEAGYDLEYVYGGDINFANKQGFLRVGGIDRIIGQNDFPVEQQTQQWGVPDGLMFDFLYNEIKSEKAEKWLKVGQTLSSHEPFDVPNFNRIPEHPFANAIAYSDSCLGAFIDRLKADTALWNNLLVVVLPDHCSTYPEMEFQEPARYHIPMVWLGGVIKEPKIIDVLGQQTDLAATLLAQLGIDHSDFNFSHNLLSNDHRPYAFYSFPDGFGLITDSCVYVQDNQQDMVPLKWSHDPEGKAQRWGRAYLQHLFDDLDKR